MVAASLERLRNDLAGLVRRGSGVRDFALGAARILVRTVPFDGFCILTTDPATLLPTGEVVENGLPASARARLAEIEIRGDDVNTFAALANTSRRAASLSETTGGRLHRSTRHREVKAPHGFGDELRAVLVSDRAVWGALTLLRADDQRHFTRGEAELVGSVSGWLADGLRQAMLLTEVGRDDPGHAETAGVAVLAVDNEIVLVDAAGERWLAELRRGDALLLPPVVSAVASRTRAIAEGRVPSSPAARARVRTDAGTWLVLRGSTLGDGPDAHVAVIIEPAPSHELAPLIADAYGLTDRERAVTALVARGLATEAISARLHISAWTVQDHLKSVFEKAGVSTRGELTARLFFDHYEPRLHDEMPGDTCPRLHRT